MKARFAAVRVRVADGQPQRIGDKGMQHMPGDEVWLVGEQRPSGEQKYYLANLPADVGLKTLAATIKTGWVCEQAHQQLKEELGLDHFEGRSWRGLHRHALMTMIAYAFLQHLRLAAASGGEKNLRRPASTDAAGHTKAVAAALAARPTDAKTAAGKSADRSIESAKVVLETVPEWQNRPLEPIYPLVFFDALRVKIRDEGLVRNKAVYVALGVTPEGTKDILGLWIETSGARNSGWASCPGVNLVDTLAVSPPELALKHRLRKLRRDRRRRMRRWRKLIAQPKTITSIGMRDWAHVGQPL